MPIDWNPKNEQRASYMAHNVLYDMAEEYMKKVKKYRPLVRVKGKPNEWENPPEVQNVIRWIYNSQLYFPKAICAKRGNLDAKCEHWFHKNCGLLIQGFLNGSGYKDIENAIASTEDYAELIGQWDEWFERRRRNFMNKMDLEIIQKFGAPAKTPSSHGGVANLLKTLTKTMEKQGASVETIAKVQYAVCTQAGIYIPSEFLTDVAVALDYKDQIKALNR